MEEVQDHAVASGKLQGPFQKSWQQQLKDQLKALCGNLGAMRNVCKGL